MRRVASMVLPLPYYICDSLAIIGVRKHEANRALVVRTDAIGDYVLWKPFGEALLNHLHGTGLDVTLVANSVWADIARESLAFDDIVALDRDRFLVDVVYRFKTLRALRKSHYAVVYLPVFSREFLVGDSLVRAAGGAVQVGHSSDKANTNNLAKRISDRFYTQLLPTRGETEHEIVRNRQFLDGIGIAPPEELRAGPFGHADNPVAAVGKYFVVAPGASCQTKRWPVARFASVARWVAKSYGWKAVVVGTKAERGLGETLRETIDGDAINLCGLTSLAELSAAIHAARLVISNDSSHVHFAFANGTPAVCIAGGGHWGRFLPYPVFDDDLPLPVTACAKMDCFGCQWRCMYPVSVEGLVRCIDLVTVEDVRAAVARALDKAGQSR